MSVQARGAHWSLMELTFMDIVKLELASWSIAQFNSGSSSVRIPLHNGRMRINFFGAFSSVCTEDGKEHIFHHGVGALRYRASVCDNTCIVFTSLK